MKKAFLILSTLFSLSLNAQNITWQNVNINVPFENTQAIPLSLVLPSFITSALKTAFEIGFLIFLPFLVIDIVIASILMSLGMMMLSPMLISFHFTLLLFVFFDGWAMTIGSISSTFCLG